MQSHVRRIEHKSTVASRDAGHVDKLLHHLELSHPALELLAFLATAASLVIRVTVI
jgi:hypothetical protein